MRRVIDTKQSTEIGECIYCRTPKGELSEEHVLPFGLNGSLVLCHASCKRCRDITSALETTLLRHQWSAARAALGTRTRHKKERQKPQPMLIEKDGEVKTIQVVWQDQWKVIQLPIFPLPAYIDNRPYMSGIESTSMDQFELSEKGQEIAKRHGADTVLLPTYPVEVFARFIAKMAYGYAVERYKLNAFEEVFVVPAILGVTADIGRWVGCSDRREFPVRDCTVSVGFRIMSRNELLVKLKMFPQFDGAEYVIVIGRVKEIYKNYFHSVGLEG
jgi:hypothetical protein